VIAEGRVEGHLCIEQGLIGLLEFVDEVLRPLTAVDVVPEHDHELEWKRLSCLCELGADLVLR